MNKHKTQNKRHQCLQNFVENKKAIFIFLFYRCNKRSIINSYFKNGKLNTMGFQNEMIYL